MKRLFKTLANLILVYLVFGLTIALGSREKTEWAKKLSRPLIKLASIIEYASDNGFSNLYLTPVSENLQRKNSLNKSIYVLHIQENDSIKVIDLYQNEVLKSNALPKFEDKSNHRHPRYGTAFYPLDSTIIYIAQWDNNRIMQYDLVQNKINFEVIFPFNFHHRIECFNGNLYVNIQREKTINNSTFLDEGYAQITYEGKVLDTLWMSNFITAYSEQQQIQGGPIIRNSQDPFHINDIEVVTKEHSTKFPRPDYFYKDDVLLSARHLDCILHFRGDTLLNRFFGAFHRQHDVDIIDSVTFRVFNNEFPSLGNSDPKSNIIYYNLASKTFIPKYTNIFSSLTEGQIQSISNFDVIENQNSGEIIIFNNNELCYRDVIRNNHDTTLKELITWMPVFTNNIFK